jgi:hypothetical protein
MAVWELVRSGAPNEQGAASSAYYDYDNQMCLQKEQQDDQAIFRCVNLE